MSIKTVLILFGVILILVAGVVFLRFNLQNLNKKTGTQQTTASVTINNHKFTVEVARTPKAQQEGLSGKKSLATDQGMLFDFGKPGTYGFWMRKMHFPIDIIYINSNKIVQIFKSTPAPQDINTVSLPIYRPDAPADKVLEINAGLSNKYKFKKGDPVTISL